MRAKLANLLRKLGECSVSDFMAGTVGAAIGATIGGVSLRYGRGEVRVAYFKAF
jgi:hypothetical protein